MTYIVLYTCFVSGRFLISGRNNQGKMFSTSRSFGGKLLVGYNIIIVKIEILQQTLFALQRYIFLSQRTPFLVPGISEHIPVLL